MAFRSGDYCFYDKLIIERKTTEDLIASGLENDGRLSRQIERMRSSNCRCSLIVEGGLMRKYHPKVPITKRAAMRSRLIYQYGIDVIETIDLRETAYAITVAIRDLLLDPDERSIARPPRTRSNRRHLKVCSPDNELRSEERGVGNGWVSTWSSRGPQ